MTLEAAALLVAAAAGAVAQSPDPCAPSLLHCTALVAPPDLNGIRATLELQPIPGPFGASVTPNGEPRYRLIASVTGLPKPATLGPYTTYVAWAYTVTMDSAVKLGVVHDGTARLGEVAREQFRVLVTAEPSSNVTERSGRIVLRGTSPGARLLAHRDLMQAVAPGVPPAPHVHDEYDWHMPPMLPGGAMTMPGMR